jgi:hypothetical protein
VEAEEPFEPLLEEERAALEAVEMAKIAAQMESREQQTWAAVVAVQAMGSSVEQVDPE